jgi:hypothetical protein
LAKRLEGKPFHLVASHCQRDTRENVVAYVKSKKLEASTPNVTVTSQGRHPKVMGNGFVPYYMVFDQHGDLVHHHMCGDYHGGDGLKMIEIVDKLLKDVPAIYLGKEPFVAVPKLAKQIGKKKNIAAALKEIDRRLAADAGREEKVELERLKAAITDYRDRMLARAEENLAKDPPEVIPGLTALQKDLKGTDLATPVDTKLAEMRKSADLRASIAMWKSYQKTMKRLDKMKEPTAKARAKAADKLEKLIEGKDSLPVTKTIRASIDQLR